MRFVSQGATVSDEADLLLWGSTVVPGGVPDSIRVVRLEDGFLRSVGLGADLIRSIFNPLNELIFISAFAKNKSKIEFESVNESFVSDIVVRNI